MTAPTEDNIVEQLVFRIIPNGRLLRTWQLNGGISARMTAFEVALPDGLTKKMILRRPGAATLARNPRAAADEFTLLRITQTAGLATQTPYHLDQFGTLLATPCLVLEYVEGRPEFAPADLNSFILQFATHLAAIHQVDCSNLDLAFLRKQADACARTVRERPADVDTTLDEGRIRAMLAALWPVPQLNESVLLHGDFWPGNTLWNQGRLVAVIDWEDAKVGDPLADLARSRLDILWIFGRAAMNAFTDQYRSRSSINFSNLAFWDLCAALRPASQLAEWAAIYPPFGRPDITESTMRAGHRWFVAQAFERLSV